LGKKHIDTSIPKLNKACYIPHFSIDNACVSYTKKVEIRKNEHARYTLERYER